MSSPKTPMPYRDLPPSAFWARCRASADFLIGDIFKPKFPLPAGTRIATAGSCFAQHIGRRLSQTSLAFVDTEPAPRLMADDIRARHGYGLFSARYGNIYTARQLRQLVEDALGQHIHTAAIWQKDGRFHDALRPSIEPEGFDSADELTAHRRFHLGRVREMLSRTDVLVFTLGLTECWEDLASGVVFPSAPGVIAGAFDPDQHRFRNFGFQDTYNDLQKAMSLMRRIQPDLKVLLTVSPVPLGATASGHHILRAATYSKSVLRAVAEEAAQSDTAVDYFPSYEIITGSPFQSQFYNANMRTVSARGVTTVMDAFLNAYGLAPEGAPPAQTAADFDDQDDDTICEDALLESLSAK